VLHLYIRKWLFLAGLILFLTAKATLAVPDPPIQMFFGDHQADPEIKVIEKNGSRFVNLPFLGKYLNIVTAWDDSKNDVFLKFGKLSIKLYCNNKVYYLNSSPQKLTEAPFEQDGQFWLPVQFLLGLGLTVIREDQAQLTLDWARNFLLGVESATYQNRPAFLLIGAKDLPLHDYLLTGPDRLVLELPGVNAHLALDSHISPNSLVTGVHLDQSVPDQLNLVFDFNKPTGYQLIRPPGQPNRVIVVFNYFLENVYFFRQDEERKILIQASSSPEYQVNITDQPHRLTIDFNGATLAGEVEPVAGDWEWVGQIRVSQLNPQVVRVEMDLLNAVACYVTPSLDHPNLIEVKTVQQINQISWAETDYGGKLNITANGEIQETVVEDKKSGQLRIDLNFLQPAAGLMAPEIKNKLVNGIRLVTVNPTLVRLEADLNRFAYYKTEILPDRKHLIISFKPSPLIGKTIVLDPGHGGDDEGACGRQGSREKDINLEICMRCKDLLEQAGAAVVLTRIGDYFVGLYERSFLANYLSADLFISVHTNNHPDLNIRGMEVYHYRGRDAAKGLAQNVLDEMVRLTGFKELGVKRDDFVVIRETQMAGILAEVGYLSNFQEENTIKTPEFKAKVALGIFQGILDYYDQPAPGGVEGSGSPVPIMPLPYILSCN
jgi:N-acetylmuramoyl-L-alanine amidase